MATDKRTSEPSLPTARRGYDRDATDKLLAELRASAGQLVGERDDACAERDRVRAELAEARALVAELEQKLDDGRDREKEITDALVVASRVRAESEREGQELKAKYKEQGAAITAEAGKKAADIVSAAGAKAEKILANSRVRIRRVENEVREAEQLAVEARARLTTLLESLLAEIEPREAEDASAADVLLVRAREATTRRKSEADPPDHVG